VSLTCGGGGTISGFSFASYGTPMGDCSTGWKKGSCDAKDTLAIVTKACVGKPSCSIPVGNSFFGGDPCFGTPKHFSGSVLCNPPSSGDRSLLLSVIVPIGTSADSYIPIVPELGQNEANIVVREGGKVVWRGGRYVAGVPGVVGARVADRGVFVTVLSGQYHFEGRNS